LKTQGQLIDRRYTAAVRAIRARLTGFLMTEEK